MADSSDPQGDMDVPDPEENPEASCVECGEEDEDEGALGGGGELGKSTVGRLYRLGVCGGVGGALRLSERG